MSNTNMMEHDADKLVRENEILEARCNRLNDLLNSAHEGWSKSIDRASNTISRLSREEAKIKALRVDISAMLEARDQASMEIDNLHLELKLAKVAYSRLESMFTSANDDLYELVNGNMRAMEEIDE